MGMEKNLFNHWFFRGDGTGRRFNTSLNLGYSATLLPLSDSAQCSLGDPLLRATHSKIPKTIKIKANTHKYENSFILRFGINMNYLN